MQTPGNSRVIMLVCKAWCPNTLSSLYWENHTLNPDYAWFLQSFIFSVNFFDLGTLQKSNGKFLFIHIQKEEKDPMEVLFHKNGLNPKPLDTSWCLLNYHA